MGSSCCFARVSAFAISSSMPPLQVVSPGVVWLGGSKPLARYGAMKSALRERLAPAELHHQWGHDPDLPTGSLRSAQAARLSTPAKASDIAVPEGEGEEPGALEGDSADL